MRTKEASDSEEHQVFNKMTKSDQVRTKKCRKKMDRTMIKRVCVCV